MSVSTASRPSATDILLIPLIKQTCPLFALSSSFLPSPISPHSPGSYFAPPPLKSLFLHSTAMSTISAYPPLAPLILPLVSPDPYFGTPLPWPVFRSSLPWPLFCFYVSLLHYPDREGLDSAVSPKRFQGGTPATNGFRAFKYRPTHKQRIATKFDTNKPVKVTPFYKQNSILSPMKFLNHATCVTSVQNIVIEAVNYRQYVPHCCWSAW